MYLYLSQSNSSSSESNKASLPRVIVVWNCKFFSKHSGQTSDLSNIIICHELFHHAVMINTKIENRDFLLEWTSDLFTLNARRTYLLIQNES